MAHELVYVDGQKMTISIGEGEQHVEAICSQDDEFDIRIGAQVALLKAGVLRWGPAFYRRYAQEGSGISGDAAVVHYDYDSLIRAVVFFVQEDVRKGAVYQATDGYYASDYSRPAILLEAARMIEIEAIC